ncbi:acyltransferase [Haloarcula sp. S1CR25-12]|uniref:Acyltransferase n=1 Tax=Haloarcula saliterrae TaxID=2950534 RepID=A0ABU2FGG1_9EURY|nr:acyltransferase [Haloarcula sp. S1CR25-12]MDS0261338.1 acyltransferase [Haloarcula sp. S1CR25-12]
MAPSPADLRLALGLLVERGPLTLATILWARATGELRRRVLTARHNISIHRTVDIQRGIKFGYDGEVDIAEECSIGRHSLVSPSGGTIRLGRNSLLNVSVTLLGNGGIDIGENVLIGPNTTIVAANHRFERTDEPIVSQELSAEGITIGDNVWIGSTCTVLDGVTIGEGAVIAAGSVVTSSVPENTIVAGSPAEVIDTRA